MYCVKLSDSSYSSINMSSGVAYCCHFVPIGNCYQISLIMIVTFISSHKDREACGCCHLLLIFITKLKFKLLCYIQIANVHNDSIAIICGLLILLAIFANTPSERASATEEDRQLVTYENNRLLQQAVSQVYIFMYVGLF